MALSALVCAVSIVVTAAIVVGILGLDLTRAVHAGCIRREVHLDGDAGGKRAAFLLELGGGICHVDHPANIPLADQVGREALEHAVGLGFRPCAALPAAAIGTLSLDLTQRSRGSGRKGMHLDTGTHGKRTVFLLELAAGRGAVRNAVHHPLAD